jgi:hypothetical protein
MLRRFWNLAVIDSFVQRTFYSEDTFVDSLLNLSSSYFMCVLCFFPIQIFNDPNTTHF